MMSNFKSKFHHLAVLPFGKLLNSQSLRFNTYNVRRSPTCTGCGEA